MFCAATSWLFPRLNLQRTKLEKGRTTRGRCPQRFQLYRQNPLQPRQSRSLKIDSPNTASEKRPPFEPGHPSSATSIPAISPPVSTRDANQESVLARSWNRHRAITSIFKGRRRTGKAPSTEAGEFVARRARRLSGHDERALSSTPPPFRRVSGLL